MYAFIHCGTPPRVWGQLNLLNFYLLVSRYTPTCVGTILCPYRAEENRFALDNTGYFGTTDIYAIVPKDNSTIDLYYLVGILNSKLLTFWYKEAGKSK